MKIDEMNLEEVEARLAEISADYEKRSGEELENLKAEVIELNQRKALLIEAEERKNTAKAIEDGKVEVTTIEERKEETKMEMRDSLEYGKAFIKAVLTGDESEARALLTENVNGNIPVPTMLDNEIRNAWEEAALLSLVKQTNYPGNVKVGFEYSATGAVVHVEGTAAPDEEVLELGTVELKAESIKKWITVSDEAIEGTTVDTLGYIYKELAQKIAEKAEEILIDKIVNSPAASTKTAPAVAVSTATTLAEDTIINALAELSGKAKNITLAMNRRTYAALKAVAAKAKYNVDVFDGMGGNVVFTDALKAFSAAGSGDTYIIAGDFGYGAQANRPSGDVLKLTVDDKSLAEKDLVKIVGKQYVGIGVVAPFAFVKVVK